MSGHIILDSTIIQNVMSSQVSELYINKTVRQKWRHAQMQDNKNDENNYEAINTIAL